MLHSGKVFDRWENKFNLPYWVTDSFDPWYQPSEDEIRCTQLIDGPRKRYLQLTEWDNPELRRDYADMLMCSEGTAIHDFYTDAGPLSEKRNRDKVYGVIVSGKPDGYRKIEAKMWDIKNKFIGWDKYPNSFKKIEEQMNIYAWQLRRRGYPIEELEAWARLRDWKPMAANRTMLKLPGSDPNYPHCQWQGPYKIKLWSFDKQDDFVCARIKDHQENPNRMCTPEERLKQQTKYKVWAKPKTEQKRCTVASYKDAKGKKCDIESHAKAMEIAKEKGLCKANGELKKGAWIEEILGEDTGCKYFCPVRSVCPHGKKFCII